MLQVNLNVSDFEIAQLVKDICSAVGYVRSVKVHRTPVPFALIEMPRREQIYDLAARFGGSTFGTCALVHLEQTEQEQTARQRVAT